MVSVSDTMKTRGLSRPSAGCALDGLVVATSDSGRGRLATRQATEAGSGRALMRATTSAMVRGASPPTAAQAASKLWLVAASAALPCPVPGRRPSSVEPVLALGAGSAAASTYGVGPTTASAQ